MTVTIEMLVLVEMQNVESAIFTAVWMKLQTQTLGWKVRHHHDEEEKYYMQIRAPIPSDSWESPSQPHEPVAAAFIEAID